MEYEMLYSIIPEISPEKRIKGIKNNRKNRKYLVKC